MASGKTRPIVITVAIAGMIAAAAMLSAGELAASDGFELARSSGCFVCHREAEKRIGPSFREVAEKYAGRKDAEAQVAESIRKGTGPTGSGWMQEGKARLPFMPANNNVTPESSLKLARWLLGVGGEIAGEARFRSESVSVTGLVARRLELSVADLQEFPQQQLDVTSSGGKPESFRGVLLRDVLERVAVTSLSRFDLKKMVIVATASDDYQVVFSWSEIFNSPIGEGVLIFSEKNGQPLPDSEGRIGIVSTRDAGTGSRYVKWLTKIEVRRIIN